MDVDTVIMSLGTSPNPLIRSTTPGLETNKHGCIVTEGDEGKTSREACTPAVTPSPVPPPSSRPWAQARLPPRPSTSTSRTSKRYI